MQTILDLLVFHYKKDYFQECTNEDLEMATDKVGETEVEESAQTKKGKRKGKADSPPQPAMTPSVAAAAARIDQKNAAKLSSSTPTKKRGSSNRRLMWTTQ